MAGSGMQVDRRTGGVMVMNAAVRVRSAIWVGTCNTLVNNNGVGGEVRAKEPMLAIDKPIPSPIRTLSEAMYDS